MFITANRIEGTSTLRSLETKTHRLYWQGLLYMDGVQAGMASVAKFAGHILPDLPSAVSDLKGIYFLAVHDKLSGDTFAFVDGSGLFHAFCSGAGVSTSFLDLAAAEKLSVSDFNPESIVEFLHFGYLSFGRTFFDKIQRLPAEQIACLSSTGKLSFIPKPACNNALSSRGSFEEFLQTFVASVSSETISLDLTGGIDSRLLAVSLQYLGLPFEVAVSGMEGSNDVAIATEVAEALGLELNITRHRVDDFGTSLPHLFRSSDGLLDLAQAHGPLQMQSERVRRGITLMLSGVGGELFKDFWWLQDFPFYSRHKPNLEKLYALRIAPIGLEHAYLSESYARVSQNYSRRFLQNLSAYVVDGNTQTYDQIYYRVKMRDSVGRFVSNHVRLLRCYAPFLEPMAAAIGYHMPRSERFFENFHRRAITHYRRDIARIRTTQGGISVSSEPGAMVADLYKYVGNKAYRLVRKLGEKAFRRRYTQNVPTSPQLIAHIRQSAAIRTALGRLKERGMIAHRLELDHIKNAYLGRMLSLSMLLDWIESAPVGVGSTSGTDALVLTDYAG